MSEFSIAQVAKRLFVILLLTMVSGAVFSLGPLPADNEHGRGFHDAEALSDDTLTLVFTGDVLLDRGVREFIDHNGVDALFSHSVDSLFHASDIVVANLECPATRIKAPVQKIYIFRGDPEWLPILKQHGITHLNLANNHSIDQGRAGLADTWENILQAGMVPVGAAPTMAEAAEPVLLASTPRPVYLLPTLQMALENFAYLPNRISVSNESIDSLVSRVARLREQCPSAYIIVSPHWGGEHTLQPNLQQKRDAKRLVDAGADILIGHHTHTLQTIDMYHGHSIYYSIGNFIFDQNRPINTQACAVQLKVTASGAEVITLPVIIKNCVPVMEKNTR